MSPSAEEVAHRQEERGHELSTVPLESSFYVPALSGLHQFGHTLKHLAPPVRPVYLPQLLLIPGPNYLRCPAPNHLCQGSAITG
jgi:hypothetical protein